jgi:hypothetical protein
LPLDLTEASAWMKHSGDAGVFEMRKARKNEREKKKR